MTQQCRACGASVPEDDKFCEECGASLAEPEAGPHCPKCGAGQSQMDAEGFCSACGFRREERGRDHLEISLSARFAAVTDRGLRHHRNEDAVALVDAEDPARFAMIVCDGVSSVTDPDLASAAAADRSRAALQEALRDGHSIGEEEMLTAVAAAQTAVAEIPFGENSERGSPATTIVAAVVQGAGISVAWLGDSRAYWVNSEGARQLTTDHSWLNDAVASGEMSEEDARKSKHAHAITRWLGADAADNSVPSLARFEIPGPGMLLLCSDGLWNYAPDAREMGEVVKSLEGDALTVARGLVEFARGKGGNDNITAAVLTFGDDGSAPDGLEQGK